MILNLNFSLERKIHTITVAKHTEFYSLNMKVILSNFIDQVLFKLTRSTWSIKFYIENKIHAYKTRLLKSSGWLIVLWIWSWFLMHSFRTFSINSSDLSDANPYTKVDCLPFWTTGCRFRCFENHWLLIFAPRVKEFYRYRAFGAVKAKAKELLSVTLSIR